MISMNHRILLFPTDRHESDTTKDKITYYLYIRKSRAQKKG